MTSWRESPAGSNRTGAPSTSPTCCAPLPARSSTRSASPSKEACNREVDDPHAAIAAAEALASINGDDPYIAWHGGEHLRLCTMLRWTMEGAKVTAPCHRFAATTSIEEARALHKELEERLRRSSSLKEWLGALTGDEQMQAGAASSAPMEAGHHQGDASAPSAGASPFGGELP